MEAVFYTFSKKENSTAQPSGGVSKNVHLKAGCSALNPTISLEWPGGGAPASYNYMYLPDFGRHYYVENWTWEGRLWTCTGRVDVLASWKSQIGAASKYVIRAAADHNYDLVDLKYPPKFPFTATAFPFTNVISWAQTFAAGQYIVSVVGTNDDFGVGGSSYYAISAQDLDQLISSAFTETSNMWSAPLTAGGLEDTLADYGLKFFKSIANPAQFINSIYWVPFKVSGATARPLKLGDLQTWASAHPLTDPITTITFSWGLPGSGGGPAQYAVEPFASYRLYLPPFGSFDLDARMMRQYRGIEGKIMVDVTNGESILEVSPLGGDGSPMIIASASIGTPIKISGSNVDYAGVERASLVAAGGAAKSLLSLDLVGAATGAAVGIIDAARAGAPSATNGGYGGGLAALRSWRGVVVSTMECAQQDPADQGYALMEVRQLSTLAGYILCADGEISAPATKAELEEIRSYMTGGFYYE